MEDRKDKTLIEILQTNRYSFHMPGHKNGRLIFDGIKDILKLDTTELPDTDNLHDAKDKILEIENRFSEYYESGRTRIVVGGSTSGILSAIMGVSDCKQKKVALIARNSHKSVYNALSLAKMETEYFYPLMSEENILFSVDKAGLETKLKILKDRIGLVVFTYPSYEGFVYELGELIKLVKRYSKNAIVIVDEAHGAGLKQLGIPGGLKLGADIVVQSLHKSLPSLTGTALLHFSKSFVQGVRDETFSDEADEKQSLSIKDEQQSPSIKRDEELIEGRVNFYLSLLQSSSPSYLMLCSMEWLSGYLLSEKSVEDFKNYSECLSKIRSDLEGHLILNDDLTKLLFKASDPENLERALREKYKIFVEMVSDNYLLAMSSVANTEYEFEILKNAILNENQPEKIGNLPERKLDRERDKSLNLGKPEKVYHMHEVFKLELEQGVERLKGHNLIGRVAAEEFTPYPPGIPLIVRGERIPKELIDRYENLTLSVLKC